MQVVHAASRQAPDNNGMSRWIVFSVVVGLTGSALGRAAAPALPPGGLEIPSLPSAPPLVFQQTLTGMLPGKTAQRRWTLRFSGASPRLDVQQRTCPGPSLKGGTAAVCKEAFGKPLLSYQGRLTPRPYGVELWLASEQHIDGFPSEMTLTCLRTLVGVLPAGARLLSGDACSGDGPPPRWLPSQTEEKGVWHCHLHDEPGSPWIGSGSVGPLTFAKGAGIEWVYVNNDCAGQEGAFRLLSSGT